MAKKKKKSAAAAAPATAAASTPATASAEPPNPEAERLRLAGNDAFMTEDWERAASLYLESLSVDPASKNSAKVNSNLAQTYVKKGMYQEAAKAAERCTSADPEWAKGWWRRATVAALNKNYLEALSHYSNALQLDKTNKVFEKDMRRCAKILGGTITREGEDGFLTYKPNDSNTKRGPNKVMKSMEDAKKTPSWRVWNRLYPEGHDIRLEYIWRSSLDLNHPTSEQWIGEGLTQWYKAMRCALFVVAFQAQHAHPACRRLVESVQALRVQMTGSTDWRPNDEFEFQCWSRFDGLLKSQVVDDLCSTFTHLAGQYIMFEMGDGQENQSRYIPIPDCLSFMPRGQALIGAINCVITCQGMELFQDLGLGNVVVSEAVHAAMYNGLRAGGASLPPHVKIGTPKEAFSCCLDKLRSGVTFDDGLRRYISLLYRGTVVFSLIIRIHGMFDKFCAYLRWAREFIELADEHFQVRETGNYTEMGSCFRASFQINILWAEIDTYHFLMPKSSKCKITSGAFPLIDLLRLMKKARGLLEIPLGTHIGDYQEYTMTTAFKRKPTAGVFSLLAVTMKDMASRMDQDDFRALLVDTGHIDADCSLSPTGIIASFYRRAAEAELPDDKNASIYWLGYGANCCEADESDGYTLGNLREALRNATLAQQCRDVRLFGPDTDAGGSYGSMCTLVCKHYSTESNDSFILPRVCITNRGKSTTLELGNEIICHDFGQFIEEERKRFADKQQEKDDRLFEEFEAEHGEAENVGVPPLAMLAIRSLHKAGYNYAKGESDPSSIILKAMQDQKA